MKRILTLSALCVTLAANATLYTTNWSSGFANGGVVPDNNLSGWIDTRTVSAIPTGTFTSLAVNLNLNSGWNGDLYAYLVHSSGFTVLLDRVGTGVSGVSSFGYGADGHMAGRQHQRQSGLLPEHEPERDVELVHRGPERWRVQHSSKLGLADGHRCRA
jgi:hypothetical protein